MNPLKFRMAMDYLTRIKKVKPDLPDVFPASQAPMPPKKESLETMEAINRFVRDNPRTEKAGGGMLVQPGFGGTRQGYRSDKTQEVKIKNSLSSKQFAAKQNIYKIDGLRKLVGPASRKLPAYKVFIQALKNAGIDFTPSTGEGVAAKFENLLTFFDLLKLYRQYLCRQIVLIFLKRVFLFLVELLLNLYQLF